MAMSPDNGYFIGQIHDYIGMEKRIHASHLNDGEHHCERRANRGILWAQRISLGRVKLKKE